MQYSSFWPKICPIKFAYAQSWTWPIPMLGLSKHLVELAFELDAIHSSNVGPQPLHSRPP